MVERRFRDQWMLHKFWLSVFRRKALGPSFNIMSQAMLMRVSGRLCYCIEIDALELSRCYIGQVFSIGLGG